MTSALQVAANRSNAKQSTGPRTDAGKAVVRLNAVGHGLRAAAPVVPGEDPADWDAYRDGIAASLAPVGTLETELADRVALLSWRLRRVTAYETGQTATAIDRATARVREDEDDDTPFRAMFVGNMLPPARTQRKVQEELADARKQLADAEQMLARLHQLAEPSDDSPIEGRAARATLETASWYILDPDTNANDPDEVSFLAECGVPKLWHDRPVQWDGWTLGAVRTGMAVIAAEAGLTVAELYERGVKLEQDDIDEATAKVARLEAERTLPVGDDSPVVAAARRAVLLPKADVADRVMRYESHLSRQLQTTLNTLERLQRARVGDAGPAPLAVDVTVNDDGGLIRSPSE